MFGNAELGQWMEHRCGSRKARGVAGEAGGLGVAFPLRRNPRPSSFEQIGV